MKYQNYLTLVLFVLFASSSINGQTPTEQEEGPSLRHSTHLLNFYSEVDYRIAKGFIDTYKDQVANKQSATVQGLNLSPALSAAIENAQFRNQYKVNGVFNGVRVYYGIKDDKKVAIVMPVTETGKVQEPPLHEAVYVVELAPGFGDPCPHLCD